MFNGIIYNQGIVTKIIKRPKGLNIFVKSNLTVSKKDIGLSVACDGVCLTLISFKSKLMEFYLSKETLVRSKFRIWNKNLWSYMSRSC
jgi:riboflavin synthase